MLKIFTVKRTTKQNMRVKIFIIKLTKGFIKYWQFFEQLPLLRVCNFCAWISGPGCFFSQQLFASFFLDRQVSLRFNLSGFHFQDLSAFMLCETTNVLPEVWLKSTTVVLKPIIISAKYNFLKSLKLNSKRLKQAISSIKEQTFLAFKFLSEPVFTGFQCKKRP